MGASKRLLLYFAILLAVFEGTNNHLCISHRAQTQVLAPQSFRRPRRFPRGHFVRTVCWYEEINAVLAGKRYLYYGHESAVA